jgi:hypothetical protein
VVRPAPDKGWEDVRAAGIELRMLALRRDALVLALFPGAPSRARYT